MSTFNEFYRGVDRDTAPEGVSRDHARDLRNFRLSTIGGQGMILTSLKGNEETFQLTDGFLPLGHAIFNGIAIIFSVDPTTGDSEIGTFPSPASPGPGFVRTYSPLQNFTGIVDPRLTPDAARLPFRTTCLGFDCTHQIDAEARISYDGSIEVFWTDFNQQLRHVSTGFRADTGADTSRLYWHGNNGVGGPVCSALNNQINVFFESCGRPSATISVEFGGSLQAGNWFFYPRYARPELSTTSFLSRIGPVQISSSQLSEGAEIQGDAELTNTGKKVVLTLSNIDPGYGLLEIGFSYHHGTTFDTGLFDRQYVIPPGATTITIDVTGDDPVIDATSAEISADKTSDDTPRSLAQTENRLWGGNWKSNLEFVAPLRPVVQAVVASAPLAAELIDLPDWRMGDPSIPFQYQNYQNTYSKVGYFRGEPYAFAVVFVMSSGKTLPPIPMTGTDHWPASPTPTNTKGIVRFFPGDTAGYEIWSGGNARGMGVKFDTSAIGAAIPPELQGLICGFYFVRAERKPQLFYQGVSTQVWHAVLGDAELWMDYALGSTSDPPGDFQVEINKNFAELRGFALNHTVMDVPFRATGSGQEYSAIYDTNADVLFAETSSQAAIFSVDHFFLKQFTDGPYHIRQQGQIGFSIFSTSGLGVYNPACVRDQVSYTGALSTFDADDVVNVADDTAASTPVGTFVSRFEEGNGLNYGGNIWFRLFGGADGREVGNRDIRQRNYLGIVSAGAHTQFAQPGNDSALLWNVYKFDPLSTDPSTIYDPGKELYFRIGDFRPISSWGGVFIEYHGDCFLQRTYIRQSSDTGFHDPSQATDPPPPGATDPVFALYYSFGNLLGIVTENVTNTAMRYQEPNYRFFPGLGDGTVDANNHMTQLNDYLESGSINKGYNRTLDIKGTLGDDPFIPIGTGFYPTRIRYSERYVNDTTTRDGYLSWGLDNYRDFDHHPGEIMALETLGGNLYSIQRHATRRHYITERYLNQGEPGAGFVLGDGDTLSDRSEVISGEMGTQHQWSVVKTDRAFYAIDFALRTAWRFGYDGFKSLSETKLFHSDVYESCQIKIGEFSDSSATSGDNPICNEGIVGWYDRRHREIGWSFLWQLEETNRYSESIVYDEKADAYMGKRYGFVNPHSPYYITINEDMYSFNPTALPWAGGAGAHSFWLHDVLVDNSTFWSNLELARLTVIVNPQSMIPKIFDNVQLAGSDVAMTRVRFNTEFQFSELNPFTLNPLFWLNPRYKENMWHYTVPKTVSITPGPNQEYAPSSPLRGKWMQAEMQWESTLPINVRSLNTFLRESLQ